MNVICAMVIEIGAVVSIIGIVVAILIYFGKSMSGLVNRVSDLKDGLMLKSDHKGICGAVQKANGEAHKRFDDNIRSTAVIVEERYERLDEKMDEGFKVARERHENLHEKMDEGFEGVDKGLKDIGIEVRTLCTEVKRLNGSAT